MSKIDTKIILSDELVNYKISKIQEIINKFIKKDLNQFSWKYNITISISSDYTTNYLADVIKLFLINKRIKSNIFQAEFGSLRFNVRNLNNIFWKRKSDFFIDAFV